MTRPGPILPKSALSSLLCRKNSNFFNFLKKSLAFGQNLWYHIQVDTTSGRLAQLVEHLLDVQEVTGSSPVPSTRFKASDESQGLFCCPDGWSVLSLESMVYSAQQLGNCRCVNVLILFAVCRKGSFIEWKRNGLQLESFV